MGRKEEKIIRFTSKVKLEDLLLIYITCVASAYPLLFDFTRVKPFFSSDFTAAIVHYLLIFLFFFLIPFIIITFIYKIPLKETGLNFKNFKKGTLFILITLPILAFLTYHGGKQEVFKRVYPFVKSMKNHPSKIVCVEFVYLFYYIGWEFFFRGIIMLILSKRLGFTGALALQTTISTIMHYSKPDGEIILALIAGLVLGYYVYKFRTIWFAILIHYITGILMDIFSMYVK